LNIYKFVNANLKISVGQSELTEVKFQGYDDGFKPYIPYMLTQLASAIIITTEIYQNPPKPPPSSTYYYHQVY